MLVLVFMRWWYGDGLRSQLTTICRQIIHQAHYFSVELLVRSLFSPFRQISAGRARGDVSSLIMAYVDRTISRCIGVLLRSVMILVAVVTISITALAQLVVLLLWVAAPVIPFVGVGLSVMGWMPW